MKKKKAIKIMSSILLTFIALIGAFLPRIAFLILFLIALFATFKEIVND